MNSPYTWTTVSPFGSQRKISITMLHPGSDIEVATRTQKMLQSRLPLGLSIVGGLILLSALFGSPLLFILTCLVAIGFSLYYAIQTSKVLPAEDIQIIRNLDDVEAAPTIGRLKNTQSYYQRGLLSTETYLEIQSIFWRLGEYGSFESPPPGVLDRVDELLLRAGGSEKERYSKLRDLITYGVTPAEDPGTTGASPKPEYSYEDDDDSDDGYRLMDETLLDDEGDTEEHAPVSLPESDDDSQDEVPVEAQKPPYNSEMPAVEVDEQDLWSGNYSDDSIHPHDRSPQPKQG